MALTDELQRTVTLEELINAAGAVAADAFEDIDNKELWLQDNDILDWLETFMCHKFDLDYAADELSEAINVAGERIYDERQERCKSK